MRVVGIIAEYNPLHNGHIYHLERARQLSGADYCIVVMSGNFAQRGEPACADKFLRAEWAVRAGADLVLELPSVYAVASAERFALGGVRTLLGTGVVTDLAFGCEAQDIGLLRRLSEILITEPPRFREALHRHLSFGKAYPRARRDALCDYGVSPDMLDAIEKPNNILALEYLRALNACAPDVRALPITRIGSGYHDQTLSGTLSSATAIRKSLDSGDTAVLEAMPVFVGGALLYDRKYPITERHFSSMLLYALRTMPPEAIAALPDVGEGFENVISRAAKRVVTLDAFYAEIKSKRYTLARCKRIAVNAMLGITAEQAYATIRAHDSVYLHALAFSDASRGLLSEIGKRRVAPLILRHSDIGACPPLTQQNLRTDALATDLFAIASESDLRRDSSGPVIV